jgi:flagellar biogenesis protein FliO
MIPSTPRQARAFSRQQKTTIIFGILSIVLMMVVLQLWLLTATMNAFLAGQERVIVPAAIASVICLVLNLGLLRYIYRMERR